MYPRPATTISVLSEGSAPLFFFCFLCFRASRFLCSLSKPAIGRQAGQRSSNSLVLSRVFDLLLPPFLLARSTAMNPTASQIGDHFSSATFVLAFSYLLRTVVAAAQRLARRVTCDSHVAVHVAVRHLTHPNRCRMIHSTGRCEVSPSAACSSGRGRPLFSLRSLPSRLASPGGSVFDCAWRRGTTCPEPLPSGAQENHCLLAPSLSVRAAMDSSLC